MGYEHNKERKKEKSQKKERKQLTNEMRLSEKSKALLLSLSPCLLQPAGPCWACASGPYR
jgi:hypothetical protein